MEVGTRRDAAAPRPACASHDLPRASRSAPSRPPQRDRPHTTAREHPCMPWHPTHTTHDSTQSAPPTHCLLLTSKHNSCATAPRAPLLHMLLALLTTRHTNVHSHTTDCIASAHNPAWPTHAQPPQHLPWRHDTHALLRPAAACTIPCHGTRVRLLTTLARPHRAPRPPNPCTHNSLAHRTHTGCTALHTAHPYPNRRRALRPSPVPIMPRPSWARCQLCHSPLGPDATHCHNRAIPFATTCHFAKSCHILPSSLCVIKTESV